MDKQPQQGVKLFKTENLGSGCFGTVCKAMRKNLPCAAKILHPTFNTIIKQKFGQECSILRSLNHPNIIQYLGMYFDPESRQWALLMELMDESLTQFLKRLQEPLPYHIEVNLCHDIALALSYLHSEDIIHRDLSSNNVLLIAGSRAKVADFGMAKLMNQILLTPCPGTPQYMPPEAQRDPPDYTEKLDSFSFGVLCVQIMTQQDPAPSNRVKAVEDFRYPTHIIEVPVPEIERRQSHIVLIDQAHPMLRVAKACLKDEKSERPSALEFCSYIGELKTFAIYKTSEQRQTFTRNGMKQIRELQQQCAQQAQSMQSLQHQLLAKDLQVQTLSNQLQGKEHQILQQRQQAENQLTATNGQLQTLQQQHTKELAIRDHQLQQKEALHQHEIQQLQKELQSIKRHLQERENTIQCLQRQIQKLQQLQRGADANTLKLSWRESEMAPCEMHGEVAVVDGSVAYFNCLMEEEIYSYDSSSKRWSELPKCPNYGFSLAIVSGLLTAIGGNIPNCDPSIIRLSCAFTDSLLSLTDNDWTEQFPPMLTKRWATTALCSGRSLVVAGGVGVGHKTLNTVEVMDTENIQWSTASNLPHPLYQASASIYGDQVYMLGGFDQSQHSSKSAFTCSLSALLQSCQPQSQGIQLKVIPPLSVWHNLASTPFVFSTCASLHGQFLAVGGCDLDNKDTDAIHIYNQTTKSWELINRMKTPRSRCHVAVFPHDKLMIVGGRTPNGKTNATETAIII